MRLKRRTGATALQRSSIKPVFRFQVVTAARRHGLCSGMWKRVAFSSVAVLRRNILPSPLTMEANGSSSTSIHMYQAKCRYVLGDSYVQFHRVLTSG